MIEFFEFQCNIKELEKFQKQIHYTSIFIVSIRGVDCNNLIVRIMQPKRLTTPAETDLKT
jgi:hypothetical protein